MSVFEPACQEVPQAILTAGLARPSNQSRVMSSVPKLVSAFSK
jgi:hypothetical protein